MDAQASQSLLLAPEQSEKACFPALLIQDREGCVERMVWQRREATLHPWRLARCALCRFRSASSARTSRPGGQVRGDSPFACFCQVARQNGSASLIAGLSPCKSPAPTYQQPIARLSTSASALLKLSRRSARPPGLRPWTLCCSLVFQGGAMPPLSCLGLRQASSWRFPGCASLQGAVVACFAGRERPLGCRLGSSLRSTPRSRTGRGVLQNVFSHVARAPGQSVPARRSTPRPYGLAAAGGAGECAALYRRGGLWPMSSRSWRDPKAEVLQRWKKR